MGAYLAVDLGATSGRVTAGRLADGRLEVREVHRFPNGPVPGPGGLHWDAGRLFASTLEGLAAGCAAGGTPAGVAVSAWGVDFGLVDGEGRLLEPPVSYRAADAARAARLREAIGDEELYARTGVQPLQINTLFRLGENVARVRPPTDSTALLTPDLWTFWLSDVRGAEHTIAGTTGLLDARTGDWDMALAAAAGIDAGLLPPVAEPGSVAGTLRPQHARRIGASGEVPVLRAASHDTASAVAAVPADGHAAFVSCGTWAPVGVELDAPVLDPRALRAGFTNEIGFGGRVRLMRNLTGLWLLEEALRRWRADDPGLTRGDLLGAAEREGPVGAFIDSGAPEFIAAGDVLARIAAACRRTGQVVPETPAQFTRCILQSLALAYRVTIETCVELTGRDVDAVHVVGGGSRNALLCQLTADACERPVIAGPAEATSMGNLLVQAVAAGELGSLEELRAVVRRSVRVDRYDPHADPRAGWDAAAAALARTPSSEANRVR
jgi:rhamnulokinase